VRSIFGSGGCVWALWRRVGLVVCADWFRAATRLRGPGGPRRVRQALFPGFARRLVFSGAVSSVGLPPGRRRLLRGAPAAAILVGGGIIRCDGQAQLAEATQGARLGPRAASARRHMAAHVRLGRGAGSLGSGRAGFRGPRPGAAVARTGIALGLGAGRQRVTAGLRCQPAWAAMMGRSDPIRALGLVAEAHWRVS
jgi:hypothetical protein